MTTPDPNGGVAQPLKTPHTPVWHELWSDERIEDFANAKYDASEYFEVFGAMVIVRDEYEADRATHLAIAKDVAEILESIEGYARDADFAQIAMDSDTILDLTKRAALLLNTLGRGEATP